MTCKGRWERLPQWLRTAVYVVHDLAAAVVAGYLGFQLIGIIVGTERMNVFWGCAGALVLIEIVLCGMLNGRQFVKRRRQSETTH
jgi:hypothetical protein